MGNKTEKILLGHGSGGHLSHQLIRELFVRYFDNPVLQEQTDAAIIPVEGQMLSFTTDSFVVDPIFFPGGDIGKLAVCGTVNDIAVTGARPKYLSAGFILEEGLLLDDLEKIVSSMAREAKKAGISIVTGDTKVVNRGKCDKVFINTTGIGFLEEKHQLIANGSTIEPGDKILINGSIGDHGISVLAARNELSIKGMVQSDCACLNGLIQKVLDVSDGIKFMRDPTRGGLATVLAELAEGKHYSLKLEEDLVYIDPKVRSFCELLGFDPLYVANEGKVVVIVKKDHAEAVLHAMRKHELGTNAAIIGEVSKDYPGNAWMQTGVGGKRILDMLAGEQLPRIC